MRHLSLPIYPCGNTFLPRGMGAPGGRNCHPMVPNPVFGVLDLAMGDRAQKASVLTPGGDFRIAVLPRSLIYGAALSTCTHARLV